MVWYFPRLSSKGLSVWAVIIHLFRPSWLCLCERILNINVTIFETFNKTVIILNSLIWYLFYSVTLTTRAASHVSRILYSNKMWGTYIIPGLVVIGGHVPERVGEADGQRSSWRASGQSAQQRTSRACARAQRLATRCWARHHAGPNVTHNCRY